MQPDSNRDTFETGQGRSCPQPDARALSGRDGEQYCFQGKPATGKISFRHAADHAGSGEEVSLLQRFLDR